MAHKAKIFTIELFYRNELINLLTSYIKWGVSILSATHFHHLPHSAIIETATCSRMLQRQLIKQCMEKKSLRNIMCYTWIRLVL